ncbi:hypothetical protein L914_15448 [Phytophthora nicotianae]|uniref:RxLR effector protein n=3 Tax=Phytophthora nicotianae TaxID=4792 RepID=V9EG56_PHYNI|nr:hypothetical protein F443_16041 [Phytophthora nicotianae P1569]ETM38187.1 hypothetical protein L914_15448 [Phytophthora nicotianae]ETO66918.1 hypothetical protein F444_16026 [Phytophthora nicotianae P1976]
MILISGVSRDRVIVLLFAVTLLASITTCTSAKISVDLSALIRPSAYDQDYGVSKRQLRTHYRAGKYDEERANTAGISQWLHGGQTADDVFKLLKLDDGVETLLSNPKLRTFMDFVDQYNMQNPGNGATAIKSVTATYGDDVVAKVLQSATKVSTTKVMAEKLLGDQRILWLSAKQSPLDVFKLLKLDDIANVNSPALNAWESYMKLFNHVNRGSGKETTMIETFTKAYGGDDALAKVLQSATKVSTTKVMAEKLLGDQRVLWLVDKRSPLDVFKLLKLDKVANNPLASPALDAWESYMKLFNYVNRGSGKETTMIDTFTKAYGDAGLAIMLNKAKMVSETENMAKNLQLQQFTLWMRKRGNPDKIYINVFKLDPKRKTIPEPYQTILNHYHWFYKHIRNIK